MKKLFLILLFSGSLQAVELKFMSPCHEEFMMKVEVTEEYANVGELTIATLSKFNIPFQGSAEALVSAFQTPVGKDAIEVVKNEIRAYGWCYSIDGISPEVYPHEAYLSPDTKSVVWHFGYARSVDGQWITQCTPAWTVQPDFLCKGTTVE